MHFYVQGEGQEPKKGGIGQKTERERESGKERDRGEFPLLGMTDTDLSTASPVDLGFCEKANSSHTDQDFKL